jgi:hypothetical protein
MPYYKAADQGMNVELAWEEFVDENRVFLGKGWDGFDVGKRSEVSLLRIVSSKPRCRGRMRGKEFVYYVFLVMVIC